MGETVLKALDNFIPRAEDAWMLQDPRYRARLMQQLILFPALALPHSAAPSCLMGIIHSFGAGEVWMIVGENFKRDARRILPLTRHLLRHAVERLRLRRLELMVRVGHAEGERWARHIGFVFECGPMRKKSPQGKDLNVFVYQQEGK